MENRAGVPGEADAIIESHAAFILDIVELDEIGIAVETVGHGKP
ncbi:hypothetical protein [Mesorhizobium sp.]